MTDNQQPSVERLCRKCGATKPVEDFALVYAKNSRGQNYRQHTCKICALQEHAERMRKARKESPEKYRQHKRDHWERHTAKCRMQRRESGQRRKLLVFNRYGGPRCVCCGETCLSMLAIDHVNNNGAEHRNEINGGFGRHKSVDLYIWLTKNDFPEGFQVLCYNCNISKHRNGGKCGHQLDEGSTTIAKASSLQAIGKRSPGRPRGAKI